MSDARSDVSTGLSRRRLLGGALGAGAVGLLGPALAGCGHQSPAALGSPVPGGAKTVRNPDVLYPAGYVGPIASRKGRITTKPAELSILVMQDAQFAGDWNTNKFTKWYEQRTGVHVNWRVIAPDDSMTKINAMIAADDIPDVLMPSPALTPSQLMYYGKQGLFRRLNELIDTYGTETRRVFRDYPHARASIAAPGGDIYTLPNVNDCYQCAAWNTRAWINKDWLHKLGLDIPKTTAEFEEALHAFKTGDPNGDGKKDVIPFAGCTDAPIDQFFMSGFCYNPGTPWLRVDGGKVVFAANTPEWREGLKYLHRLGTKGLIAPTTFTQATDALVRLGNSKKPVLGSSVGGTWGYFMTLEDASKDPLYTHYPAMPPLKGPDGTQIGAWDYTVAVEAGRFMITKACRNPEIALMWGDGLFELEAVERSYAGPLGQTWDWARRGQLGQTDHQAVYAPDLHADAAKPGDCWSQMGIQYRSLDYRNGTTVDRSKKHNWGLELDVLTAADYHPHRQPREQQLPKQFMTADQVGESGEAQTTIENAVKQALADFTLGKRNPNSDSDWKSYLDTLSGMGVGRLVRINQEAYDAKR